MFTVSQIAKITGVSRRTLRYYDSIGLLSPSSLTEAGYRLYDEKRLDRLRSILLYRELKFSLEDIKRILDSPDFDRDKALNEQIEMLKASLQRTQQLISFAQQVKEKGVFTVSFKVFDKDITDKYKKEAEEKWGGTDAWAEYKQKEQTAPKGHMESAAEQMMDIFSRFGRIKNTDPADMPAQNLAAQLQKFITDNFYTCTDDIFRSLGEMYVSDERFKNNIDKSGGEGTAVFAAEAIRIYCEKG